MVVVDFFGCCCGVQVGVERGDMVQDQPRKASCGAVSAAFEGWWSSFETRHNGFYGSHGNPDGKMKKNANPVVSQVLSDLHLSKTWIPIWLYQNIPYLTWQYWYHWPSILLYDILFLFQGIAKDSIPLNAKASVLWWPAYWPISIVNCKQLELINLASPTNHLQKLSNSRFRIPFLFRRFTHHLMRW